MASENNRPAVSKRLKISKAQQITLVEVLIASLAVGVCLVLIIYFVKYINFNTKVITDKDAAIASFEETINNVGICNTAGADKKYTIDELNNCNPDTTDASSGTLRYAVLNDLTNNKALESVAPDSEAGCYNSNNEKIDYAKKYQESTTDAERTENLDMIKVCSSLRVIPDALPSSNNVSALMSSVNQLYIIAGTVPESLAPGDSSSNSSEDDGTGSESGATTLGTSSISLRGEQVRSSEVFDTLRVFERSIRVFNFQSATFEWSGSSDTLDFSASAEAYYTGASSLEISQGTTAASSTAQSSATTTSTTTGDSN